MKQQLNAPKAHGTTIESANAAPSPPTPKGAGVRVKELSAVMLLAFGIILAFVALLMPPPGEIHDSVLFIFAQILIYCGSIFGIESYINRKIKGDAPS